MDDLKPRLASLIHQKQQLLDQGVLMDVRLEKAAAAGTASQKAHGDYKYARLRSGKGKLLPNGKRSQYVSVDEIADVEAKIQRGRELKQIEREIDKLQRLLDRMELQASKLGLTGTIEPRMGTIERHN